MLVQWRPTPAGLARRLARLDGAELTFRDVGAVERDAVPEGCTAFEQCTVLPDGPGSYDRVGEALLDWRLHREAGMVLAATADSAGVGVRIVSAAPLGPIGVLAPCEVVRVLDEPDRRGFTYASLPGHRVQGEEQLSVERDGERTLFRMRSVSRPVGIGRLAPPLVRAGQQLVNCRYASAASRLAG